MAKFRRFDPRNKKANSHKNKSKNGMSFKRIKFIEKKVDYDEKTIRTQGG